MLKSSETNCMFKFLTIFFLFIASFLFSQGASKSKCYDLAEVLKVEPTPLYKPHLDASKSFNIKILKDEKNVQKYISKGKLKKVNKLGKGYKIQKLNYSRAYLTSKSKISLEKIAAKFNKETKGSTLTISSVTRTLEDQCNLRKVNSNASLGISSHNYGNSFDISYVRFNNVLKHNPKLDKALENVLDYYVKAGRIYYIKEKQQACYHVTVRNY